MELIEGVALSKLCDYSFGDQSGQWGNIYTSFMKDANFLNTEFATKVFEVMQTRDHMTVFIDNIRLYKRQIESVTGNAVEKVESGLDPLGRGQQYKAVPIDDTYPKYIQENQEKYSHLIKPWN